MGKHSTQTHLVIVGQPLGRRRRPGQGSGAGGAGHQAPVAERRQQSLFGADLELAPEPVEVERPTTYADCRRLVGDGPCPYVGCRYHLFFETTSGKRSHGRRLAGAIGIGAKSARRDHIYDHELDMAAEEVVAGEREWCSLRVVAANPDGLTRDQVGELMDLTKERVRQLEGQARDALAEADVTSS